MFFKCFFKCFYNLTAFLLGILAYDVFIVGGSHGLSNWLPVIYFYAFVVCSGCFSLALSGLVFLTALPRLFLGYVSCASTLRAMFPLRNWSFDVGIASNVLS